jgi:hypothetical protein
MALSERAPELRGTITRIRKASRNPAVVFMVGGKAVLDDPEVVHRVGANVAITDAREAPAAARAALHAPAAGSPGPVAER